ncbi:MAG: TolC family protein, partial [Candidatus Omnitrophota bacterium]
MFKKIILTIFFISIFYVTSYAEDTFELDLNKAIEIALKNNLDVKIDREEIDIKQGQIQEAKSGFWPQVESNFAYTRTNELYPKNLDTISNTVGIKYNLFDWGRTKNLVKASKAGKHIEEANLDLQIQDLIYQVAYNFYTILLSEDFVKVNQEYLELAKLVFETNKERFRKGLVSQEDLLKVEEDVLLRTQLLEDSINQLEILKNNLKKI